MGFVIKAVQKSAPGLASAAEIPESFKTDFEAIWTHLREHPDQEGYVEFVDDTDATAPDVPEDERQTAEESLKNWRRWAPVYANTREAGALKYRQLNSKNLKNAVRFQITLDLPENGAREGNA